jgi:hypothetical protein
VSQEDVFHIRPNRSPYPLILRHLIRDSRAYHTAEQMLDRICWALWIYQHHHVADPDQEGVAMTVLRDEFWHRIRSWCHTRPAIEWLCSAEGEWPDYFHRWLTWQALQQE